jgi:DNA-binding XRE family transcriptional regulator
MSIFGGLGRSLRWLRERQAKRQYQVAEAAGITKAMLSAYETGKQKPSLETLEKILGALGCDLNDLHNAVQIVNERPEAIRRPMAPFSGPAAIAASVSPAVSPGAPPTLRSGDGGNAVPPSGAPGARGEPGKGTGEPVSAADGGDNLYSILQIDGPLPAEMEQAMSEMLGGFHKLLRYMHSVLTHPSLPRPTLNASPRG